MKYPTYNLAQWKPFQSIILGPAPCPSVEPDEYIGRY